MSDTKASEGETTSKTAEEILSRFSEKERELLERHFSSMNQNKIIRKRFTKDEDKNLKKIVESMHVLDWDAIASKMEGRTARQCKDRWLNYLSPSVNTNEWTKEEDEILISKYKEYGPKWVNISRCLTNRTDISVKNRWISIMRKNAYAESVGIPKSIDFDITFNQDINDCFINDL